MQSGRYGDTPNWPKCRSPQSAYRERAHRPVIVHGADKHRSTLADWFCDCAIPSRDVDVRRHVGFLHPYAIWEAQEGTDGRSANMKNTRRDLYKRFRHGCPITARLPYASLEKLIQIVGILRFVLHIPLGSAKVKGGGACRGRIYRRS